MQKDPEAAAAAGRLLRFFAFGADRDGAPLDAPELGIEDAAQVVCADADAVIAAIERHRRAPRRARLRHRRRGRPPARARGVRGGRLQQPPSRAARSRSSTRPRSGLTKLLAVEWPVGKIGRVPPRARVEPVFVGGVTVENITLHNPRLIRERDLRIGDTVAVVRRGDVIPFAGRAILEDRDGSEQEIVPPDALPVVRLRARGARHGRGALVPEPPVPGAGDAAADALGLARRAADMEGVGDVWIEKLADDGVLRRRSDFYTLTAEQLLGYERMGEVSAPQHGRLDRSAPRASACAAR